MITSVPGVYVAASVISNKSNASSNKSKMGSNTTGIASGTVDSENHRKENKKAKLQHPTTATGSTVTTIVPVCGPKIMKNDIRRYMARMFMNTVNSGDFMNIQNYFNTFMTNSCQFIADHTARADFNIPPRMHVDGPRIMAHYLLGCFVMYPDMVVTMVDSRIVTSKHWAGTKIHMDVSISSTKMRELEFESWVPVREALSDLYAKSAPVVAAATAAANGGAADPEVTHETEETDTSEAADGDAAGAIGPRVAAAATGGSTSSTSGKRKAEVTDNEENGQYQVEVYEVEEEEEGLFTPHSTVSEITSSTCAGGSRIGSSTGGINKNTTSTAVITAAEVKVEENQTTSCSHIPESFITSVFTQSVLVANPLSLCLKGVITIYLNENNHMHHVNMKLAESPEVLMLAAAAAAAGGGGLKTEL